jgi:nitroreductase
LAKLTQIEVRMRKHAFIPLSEHPNYPLEEMARRAETFYERVKSRRSVRHFSPQPVPKDVIVSCLQAAGTAPNGANMQPWHFVVVTDPAVKSRIRRAAEEEERALYERRASPEWLEALEKMGTDWHKPYLDIAPVLIAIFAQSFTFSPDGQKIKHYYVQESVGIAAGILITAFHHAGLATLTHTPSPMNFLNEILNRPTHERPFLLLVVGFPAADALVPDIDKKALAEIASFIEA